MPEWTLSIRDVGMVRTGLLLEYVDFEAISRLNRAGSWVLNCPGDLPGAESIDYRSGIIVERDGVILFSGQVMSIKRHIGRDTSAAGMLTVAGTDDLGFIADRVAWPNPAVYPEDWAVASHDAVMAAELAIRSYVADNAGQTALPERAINGLTLGDYGGLGRTISRQARLENLLDLVTGICDEDDSIRVSVVQVGTSGPRVLRFDVSPRVDRSSTLLVGLELGNLDDVEVTEMRATANYVIVGGEGEGSAREMVSVGFSDSVNRYGRVERFVDGRRNADTAGLVSQGVQEALLNGGNLQITATGRSDALPRYGPDFQLGDTLGLLYLGDRYKVTCREARITLGRDGANVVPLFDGRANTVSEPTWERPS